MPGDFPYCLAIHDIVCICISSIVNKWRHKVNIPHHHGGALDEGAQMLPVDFKK